MFVSSHKMTFFAPCLFSHHEDIRVTTSYRVTNLGHRFLASSTVFDFCRKTRRIIESEVLKKSLNGGNVVVSRPHSTHAPIPIESTGTTLQTKSWSSPFSSSGQGHRCTRQQQRRVARTSRHNLYGLLQLHR